MYRITYWVKLEGGKHCQAYILAPHFIQGEGGSVSAVVGGKHISIKSRDLISIELIKGV